MVGWTVINTLNSICRQNIFLYMPWNLYELYRTINKYCYASQQFCEISKLLLKQYRNRTLFISFMNTHQNRGDCARLDSWKSWKFQILATDPRPKWRFPFFEFIINAPDYGRENRSEIQKTHFFHFLCFFSSVWEFCRCDRLLKIVPNAIFGVSGLPKSQI